MSYIYTLMSGPAWFLGRTMFWAERRSGNPQWVRSGWPWKNKRCVMTNLNLTFIELEISTQTLKIYSWVGGLNGMHGPN